MRRDIMFRRLSISIIVYLLFSVLVISLLYSQEEKVFSREELIKDCRQLAQSLESAHPDPYINGAGKIAFHRRLQNTLQAIPAEGMTLNEFYKLLLPFVAAVRDGHTAIVNPENQQNPEPGLPIGFNIVEEILYVDSVYNKAHEPLLGAKLISVEGVPFAELKEHQKKTWGYDNEYANLRNLQRSLSIKRGLDILLPEWKEGEKIKAIFQLHTGKQEECEFALPDEMPANPIAPKTKVNLPSVEKTDFVYNFMDEEKRIALLRIDSMMSYREAFEWFSTLGLSWVKKSAEQAYERFNGIDAPEDLKETIAGIPSATETFRLLVEEMKKYKTGVLLIDLRENTGGNSAMSDILLYFLFGHEALSSLDSGYQIVKYSDLYFDNYKKNSLDEINQDRDFRLTENDYNFKSEYEYKLGAVDKKARDEELNEYLKLMPTFEKEYRSGKYSGFYLPEHVVVLCSPRTASSGFLMMSSLYHLGATVVGTPSAQAGNCFGDILIYKFNNTGIIGYVSHKRFVEFPDDAEKGQVLRPHYELSYEKLASYNFDPNAEVLFALEVLERAK
jgi:hypothetical protein